MFWSALSLIYAWYPWSLDFSVQFNQPIFWVLAMLLCALSFLSLFPQGNSFSFSQNLSAYLSLLSKAHFSLLAWYFIPLEFYIFPWACQYRLIWVWKLVAPFKLHELSCKDLCIPRLILLARWSHYFSINALKKFLVPILRLQFPCTEVRLQEMWYFLCCLFENPSQRNNLF